MIDPNTPTSCHLFRLVKKPQEPKGMPFRSTQRLELVPTRHLKVAVGREMSTDMDNGGEGSQTVARIANLFPGLNCELPSPPHSLGGPDPLQTQPGVCRENVRRLLFSSCSTKFLPQLGTAELLCSRIHVSNPDPISEFALYHY